MVRGSDLVFFEKLGVTVRLQGTTKGHYAVPMFDFGGVCCNLAENSNRSRVSRGYEASKHQASLTRDCGRDPALPHHAGLLHGTQGVRQDPSDAAGTGELTRKSPAADPGWIPRHGDRWSQESRRRPGDHSGWQVWQEEGARDPYIDLQQRQELCSVGLCPHWAEQCSRDATVSNLRALPRPGKETEVAEVQHGPSSDATQDVQCAGPEALSGPRPGRDGHGLEARRPDGTALIGASHRPPKVHAELDNHDSGCHASSNPPFGEHEGKGAACASRSDGTHGQHDLHIGGKSTQNKSVVREACAEIYQCTNQCPHQSNDEKSECDLVGVLKQKERQKLEKMLLM